MRRRRSPSATAPGSRTSANRLGRIRIVPPNVVGEGVAERTNRYVRPSGRLHGLLTTVQPSREPGRPALARHGQPLAPSLHPPRTGVLTPPRPPTEDRQS